MAGVTGAVFLIVTSIFGKFVLEVVNFMEHYGMVRNPDVPVQPRHSWNTNKRLSSWTMFNLTRHSHHHAQGEVPYHELKSYQDAPMMIGGYLTTMLVALVPPLWNKLMVPKVLAWDQNYATQEELMLANEANRNSGIPAFEKVQYKASNT
jgi:alkane 1-monooxygenase